MPKVELYKETGEFVLTDENVPNALVIFDYEPDGGATGSLYLEKENGLEFVKTDGYADDKGNGHEFFAQMLNEAR